VARIEEPYATMVYVAVYTGLRVSELIALRWSDIREQSITVEEQHCRGDWRVPKSAASNTTIPVSRKVIEQMQRSRTLTIAVKAGRAIWSPPRCSTGSRCGTTTFWCSISSRLDGNWEISWVNWLVLRRSYVIWLRMVGTDPRNRQSVMRHFPFYDDGQDL